jgi:hypothetical protein
MMTIIIVNQSSMMGARYMNQAADLHAEKAANIHGSTATILITVVKVKIKRPCKLQLLTDTGI